MDRKPASVWPLAIGGMIALAAAMGIGRFVYTPILPFMADAVPLNESQAGFIASANYLGYLLGALAGALGALYVGGFTLNIFSMIGLLLLAGIVKKNSIILVDYAQVAREQGADARAAMMTAGPTRLRPILMTSVATAMAALPAALGLGQGSETRTPMAVAVIGGLAVSTVLSLFVVPAFYVVADGAKRALGFGRKLGNLGDV